MGADNEDDDANEPSLELPSLSLAGLGRKRRRTRNESTVASQTEAVTEAEPTTFETVPQVDVLSAPLWTRTPVLAVAIITGLIVGLLGTAVAYASTRGCELVRGTSSCGRPGFFFLIAIIVVMALVGGILLKTAQLADPNSTSCLAVGIVCVIVLVALLDVILSGWMFIVIPLVSAAAFAASHWMTSHFDDVDQVRPE